METNTRSELFESIPQGGEIQNGEIQKIHQDILPTSGVGYLNRFRGRLLSCTNTGIVQEISEILYPGQVISVQSPAIWTVHSSHGIHCNSQGGETDGNAQGYKDSTIPKRLVGESQIPPYLSPAYSGTRGNLSESGLYGKLRDIRAGPQTSLGLRR